MKSGHGMLCLVHRGMCSKFMVQNCMSEVSAEVVWAKESLAGNGGICGVPGSQSDMDVVCG